MKSQGIKPVSSKERMIELDIIRGFALFGVLLVNIVMFNTTLFSKVATTAPLSDPLQLQTFSDKISALFIQIFAEGKFYTIFSFLFGLGFYVFMERVEMKELPPNKLFRRRLLFLFLFGILHFSLVWYGDILHVYGFVGLFLMLFRKRSLKTIKIWIVILLVLSTLIFSGFTFLNEWFTASLDGESLIAQEKALNDLMEKSIEVYKNGNFLQVVNYRLTQELPFVAMNLVFLIPKILGMFLIGLYAGKKGVFKDVTGNLDLIKKTWRAGGIIGGGATILYVLLQLNQTTINPFMYASAVTALKEMATVLLSLFYITSLLLLLRKEKYNSILHPLRYMGQLALTNYLVQCILCSLIFYGYGLGLLNEAGVATGVLITFVIYGGQLVFSKKWLEKFRYGPFEWIWRRLTYGSSL
ncbi:DUF418 domain-containing protein [Natronincola peptidivorans]|uniref:DUF418 domain-containing protein n=1 Tax=Natronincola peptidivorans TaxID=426128 RepID=UPI001FCC605C|nr:DUF418 domain-containing protein [Natronincola peptidivorans]